MSEKNPSVNANDVTQKTPEDVAAANKGLGGTNTVTAGADAGAQQPNQTQKLGAVSSTQALSAAQLAQKAAAERVAQQAQRAQQSPALTAQQSEDLHTEKPANADTRVLRTGEVANSTMEGLAGGKTYYHRIAGARTTMPDGLEIIFAGGMFATADPEIQRELDKVANKASSQIFTRRESLDAVRAQEQRAASEAADTVGNNKNM